MLEYLIDRLGVTPMQVEMAFYSGAIPTNIDPEPFILHWEQKLTRRRALHQPNKSIYDQPIPGKTCNKA